MSGFWPYWHGETELLELGARCQTTDESTVIMHRFVKAGIAPHYTIQHNYWRWPRD